MDDDQLIQLMAALILAVRTARFDSDDFNGAMRPRVYVAISDSLLLAKQLHRAFDRRRADEQILARQKE